MGGAHDVYVDCGRRSSTTFTLLISLQLNDFSFIETLFLFNDGFRIHVTMVNLICCPHILRRDFGQFEFYKTSLSIPL